MESINVNITTEYPTAEDNNLWELAKDWATYVVIAIAVMGWLGNFLCYRTARCMPEPSNATVLMKFLAAWNSIAVTFQGVIAIIGFRSFTTPSRILNVNPSHPDSSEHELQEKLLVSFQEALCKVFPLFSFGAFITGHYHVAAMAIDRVVCLKFPVFYKLHLQLGKAKISVSKLSVVATVCLFLLGAHISTGYSIEPETNLCWASNTSVSYRISFFVAILTGQALPFLVILACNILFSIALVSRRRKRDE